jgi:hypothetical protein
VKQKATFAADVSMNAGYIFNSQALNLSDSALIVKQKATFNADISMNSGFNFNSQALELHDTSLLVKQASTFGADVTMNAGKVFTSEALGLSDSLVSVKQNMTLSTGKVLDASTAYGTSVLVPTVYYSTNNKSAVNTESLTSAVAELKQYMSNMVEFDATALENFKTLSTYLNNIEKVDSNNLAASYTSLLARIDWLYVALYKNSSMSVIKDTAVSYYDASIGATATINSTTISPTLSTGATVYAPTATGATYGVSPGVYGVVGSTGAIGAV